MHEGINCWASYALQDTVSGDAVKKDSHIVTTLYSDYIATVGGDGRHSHHSHKCTSTPSARETFACTSRTHHLSSTCTGALVAFEPARNFDSLSPPDHTAAAAAVANVLIAADSAGNSDKCVKLVFFFQVWFWFPLSATSPPLSSSLIPPAAMSSVSAPRRRARG